MAAPSPKPLPVEGSLQVPHRGRAGVLLGMLWRDKFATFAVLFLIIAILCAIVGPALLGEAATKQNLRGRNAPPFSLEQGWLFILGADALGRPLLARIVVAAQNTLMVAAGAVVLSASFGAVLGLIAGYGRGGSAPSSCGLPT
jgi:peptide/nickel transport system permease protein